ncbi:MAG: hypothetical protein H8E19_14725 [Deltaproteobacteria bacterium]|uniref:Uncharacterized protein n=1 Tax=Candidatus Desulfacyla euxinica TaxID=2841693 RepID=A0A8J6T492_9DELT|nr:hypothetical protein [Candidatus Desulfacyla euxinica]MBL7217688.1 hypothetical protein [Desulfobacteraceae bacterium]
MSFSPREITPLFEQTEARVLITHSKQKTFALRMLCNKFVYLKPEMPLGQESELVNRMGVLMKTIPDIKGIKVVS